MIHDATSGLSITTFDVVTMQVFQNHSRLGQVTTFEN